MVYELYNLFNLEIGITFNGDCFDRLLLRIYEMKVSCLLIRECVPFISVINFGDIYCIDINIESIIYLFGSMISVVSYGLSLSSVEASKGEYCVILGVYCN